VTHFRYARLYPYRISVAAFHASSGIALSPVLDFPPTEFISFFVADGHRSSFWWVPRADRPYDGSTSSPAVDKAPGSSIWNSNWTTQPSAAPPGERTRGPWFASFPGVLPPFMTNLFSSIFLRGDGKNLSKRINPLRSPLSLIFRWF